MEREKTLTLLRLDPQEHPVYFVVETYGDPPATEDDREHLMYFYEEHSCPTNYIRCEAIISKNDTDPHGLFTYVRSIPRPKALDEAHYADALWNGAFPEAFRKPES